MNYRPGDVVYVEFVTSRFDTGAATNGDTTPTGTLNKNGTDDGAVTVTVTNVDTGRYKASLTIPDTYLLGDVLNLTIAATVNSVAGKGAVWHTILQGPGVIRYSKATAGGATTVTLDASASATNDYYLGAELFIYGGTGAGQSARCVGYVGSTKVATVERAWATNPASGSLVAIRSNPGPKVDSSLRTDLGLWVGNAPDALSSGKVPADVKLWLTAAPATLSTNGYVKSILLRWLTDDAGGTPVALSTGNVASDVKLWLAAAPASLSTNGYVKSILLRWLTDDSPGTPSALSSGNVAADLKLWLAVAPVALSSQFVQAIVADYASGKVPLQPTVVGNTLDVSATGEAGLDFANIKNATSPHTLTNITVPATTDVTNDVGITQTGADKVWASAARSLTTFGTLIADIWAYATRTLSAISDSSGVTTLLGRIIGTLATGTHQPQSGDAYALIGAAGVGLTNLGDARLANLDAAVSTRSTLGGTAQTGDAFARLGTPANGTVSQDIADMAAGAVVYGETGAITFTYTVFKPDNVTPLPNAAVYVSSDAIGTLRSATKITDSLGRVQFGLDPGDAYFWPSHADYTFDNPDLETVSP